VQTGRLAPPARLGPRGLRNDLLRQLLHHRVAREACDRAQVGVRFDPRHHLGLGKVTVTAEDAPGGGPGVPPPLDHALAHRQHVCATEAFGLEARGAQTPREARIKVQGQETIATLIAIVVALFLGTMSAVLGIIDSEHDALGWTVDCPIIGRYGVNPMDAFGSHE